MASAYHVIEQDGLGLSCDRAGCPRPIMFGMYSFGFENDHINSVR